MAEKDEGKQDQRDAGDDGSDAARAKGPALKDYLKVGATILLSLVLFAGVLRGCAACQKKNPITGEQVQQPAPPAPPAAAPQPGPPPGEAPSDTPSGGNGGSGDKPSGGENK